MKVKFKEFQINEAELIIIPTFLGQETSSKGLAAMQLTELIGKERYRGEHGENYITSIDIEDKKHDVMFLGLGKEAELDGEKIRAAYAKALKKSRELKVKKVYVELFKGSKLCFGGALKSMVEGLCLGDYSFDKYKSKKTKSNDIEFSFGNIDEDKAEEAKEYIKEAKTLAKATFIARDLVNEPANVLYPETLAAAAKENGIEFGFEVEVLDVKDIEKLEMKAFLSVGMGSINEPKLIIMRYFGDSDNKSEVLGLVGKGLTYDSGGYSLKTNDGMVTMKSDMAGSASVIGALSAIAKNKLKVNVVGVIAACENLLSDHSYKPGDIIGSMAGKTIEVLNTDAEGRLTLADAVYYTVEKEKATRVVDIATLTGAALVALGVTTTAAVTNNEEFFKAVEEASKKSGERVWQLPAFEEYKKLLKSDIADLKNIGGKHAGTITGGLFIGEFVEDKPWVHLDIAGTSWSESEREYFAKGGTGVGVRTLYYLAKSSQGKN